MQLKKTVYMFLALSIVLLAGLLFNNSPLAPQTTSVQGVDTEVTPSDVLSVSRVIDGDTVELSNGEKVRLIGINTPEKDQPYYAEAKKKLEEYVLEKAIKLETDTVAKDMYERTLGYLYSGDSFINQKMIESGYALLDTVPPNVKHVDSLVTAQDKAKKECSGIWEGLCKPTASSCVQISEINKEGKQKNNEWIELINTCKTSQDISGYLIKDTSASNFYEFTSASMSAMATLRVFSGCGVNTRTSFYWKCPEQQNFVWNNDTDRAYLFDNNGKMISEMGY